MKTDSKFATNDAAFTGLEAAIVLIAFVVVAAVFSYVMLGAGFFTSQKSKEVVHTGVDQATASVDINGNIIGIGDIGDNVLDGADITLQLTAGQNPIDMTKLVVSYKTSSNYEPNIFHPGADLTWVTTNQPGGNNILELNEKAMLTLHFPDGVRVDPNGNAYAGGDERAGGDSQVTIGILPATGATLTVTFTVPPKIKSIMYLG
jgi:flagellin FlaB